MKINRHLLAAAVMVVACAPTSAVRAQERWYVGVDAGRVSADIGSDAFNHFFTSLPSPPVQSAWSTLDVDSDGNAWSVYAGYRLSQYFSVRAGYIDLGEQLFQYSATYRLPSGTTNPFTRTSVYFTTGAIDTTGWSLSGVGAVSMGKRFDAHIQLGATRTTTVLTSLVTESGISYPKDGSESSQSWLLGVGVGYRLTENWTIDLNARRFGSVGHKTKTVEGDYSMLSVGAMFHF